MTVDEAKEVMKLASAGVVAQTLEDERYLFLMGHLLPLPYEQTRERVHQYVANNKWVSTLEELCDACGLPPDNARADIHARRDLTTAVREGGILVADLRAMSGWAYVRPGEALPPGAVEAQELGREAPRAALPEGKTVFTEGERKANLRRLGSLARDFYAAKKVGP